jgi:hypothetical protein
VLEMVSQLKCDILDKKGSCKGELVRIKDLNTPDSGPGADEYARYLRMCVSCSQFYIQQFIEWWSHDGNDQMDNWYLPIEIESLQEINSQGWSDILSNNIYFVTDQGWIMKKTDS